MNLTLADDNTIVINKADKAVVQNHDDYAREGFDHLGDAAVYMKLPYDTTMEVDLLVTNFVKRLYRERVAEQRDGRFLPPQLISQDC